jgi:uncharacterized protein YkwD
VFQKLVLVLLAVLVAAGLVGGRALTLPGATPASVSEKTSTCGEVGLPAGELRLERTRELTLCLLNEQRARHAVPPLRYDVRLERASQRHSDDMVRRRFFGGGPTEGPAATYTTDFGGPPQR